MAKRLPVVVSQSDSLLPGFESVRSSYVYLHYSGVYVRSDVADAVAKHLRGDSTGQVGIMPRKLVRWLKLTGGEVVKYRGRVAGYVYNYCAYSLPGYEVHYRGGAAWVALRSCELINRRHPSTYREPAVVVSDDYSYSFTPVIVELADFRQYVRGGDLYRRMLRDRDRSIFDYYWYRESDLIPEPFTTEGGHVWNLPLLHRVHVDREDFPDWADEDDGDDYSGPPSWDRGIGQHNLKRRYTGPVMGVELEVDSDDRGELGRVCKSAGVHTCRDGSLDDCSGIELVAAPLEWSELRGDSSSWGRVFGAGDFEVSKPADYGLHCSLNRAAISRGAQARIFYALNRWASLSRVFGRGSTSYARKLERESAATVRKQAYRAVNRGTDKYVAANFASSERLEVRCIASTADWAEFRARVGMVDALRLFAEYTGWGGFTAENLKWFMCERLLDSHPEAVAAYCGVSRRSGRPVDGAVWASVMDASEVA